MTLRRLHAASALVLLGFLALHLGNHLAGLAGQEIHGKVMQALRPFYRNPLAEPLLVGLFLWQALSGLRLAWRRKQAKGWARLQVVSGIYLALFILVHISIVLLVRLVQGVDTDLAFAAAGLHAGGIGPWLFAPYYGLAVVAVFAHIAVPLRRRAGPAAACSALAAGAVTSIALVLLLAGWIVPLTIPASLVAAFPVGQGRTWTKQ